MPLGKTTVTLYQHPNAHWHYPLLTRPKTIIDDILVHWPHTFHHFFCWTKHRILPWYGHNVETGQLPPTRLGRILLNGWLFECKIINQTMNYNHEKITVCSTAQTSVWSMSTDPFRKCGCHPKCYSPHVCNSNKFIWKHHQTMRSSCPNREMLQ